MTTYIQYDDQGVITATVNSFGIPAPNYPRQISALKPSPDYARIKINILTKEIETKAIIEEITSEPLSLDDPLPDVIPNLSSQEPENDDRTDG